MKRKALITQLIRGGCYLDRSKGKHDVYKNPATNTIAPVPRHTEIKETLCMLIRKQLGIGR